MVFPLVGFELSQTRQESQRLRRKPFIETKRTVLKYGAIQNRPLPADASTMMQSELDTRWMAAIILCPKNFRDPYVADFKAQKIAPFDIAEIFDIPEWVAPFVMDDYYDSAFARLVGAPPQS